MWAFGAVVCVVLVRKSACLRFCVCESESARETRENVCVC